MKIKIILSSITIIFLAAFLAMPALARIGVGVGTGTIRLNKDLNLGAIYNLPGLTVINTGDENSNYSVGVEYLQDAKELRPEKSWFSFSPQNFSLEPGQAQFVEVQLTLPMKGVQPGDYFAYLESHPVNINVQNGQTGVGVAAAAKLYFKIAPANIFSAIYYRTASLINAYSPTSIVVLVVILAAIVITILGRSFSLNIGFRRKKND